MAQSEAFYTFLVEWYDSQAALVRPFNMRYFLQDGQIDMFDLKSRKTFLKKCSYPAITLADLYPGAQVTVFARTLKVVDYADQITRSSLASKKQSMVLKLKNNSLGALADILTDLAKASLTVSALRRCIVNGQDMTVIQVLGEETPKYISAYKSAGGRSSEAKSSSSSSSWSSVEALEGKSATDLYNEVFKSTIDTPVVAATLARPGATSSLTTSSGSKTRPSTTAKLDGAITVAVVRPHAVQTGAAGPILDQLARHGFHCTAVEQFALDRPAAQEFCEVYKGVVPEYHGMIEQFTAGPMLALELQLPSAPESVVPRLREVCGPADPAIATHLRPNTIRAKFGQNKVLNAIHCTDLPEDGPLESQYFFSILQQK